MYSTSESRLALPNRRYCVLKLSNVMVYFCSNSAEAKHFIYARNGSWKYHLTIGKAAKALFDRMLDLRNDETLLVQRAC